MRGNDQQQTAMFSYLTLAQRIPADHPARQIRVLVDRALERMGSEFEKLYSDTSRPSIAPERLLRATLLMILYSIRSERQLMEQMNYNLLFRWFVGLEMDDAVWDVTVFTKNRERLIAGETSQKLLESVLVEARAHDLLSEEHFTVEGEVRSSQAWQGFRTQGRSAFARQGGVDDRSGCAFVQEGHGGQIGSGLSGPCADENRNGLVVAAETSLAATIAEREMALAMLDRLVEPKEEHQIKSVVRPAENNDGVLIFDDTIREKDGRIKTS
jgi:transposase